MRIYLTGIYCMRIFYKKRNGDTTFKIGAFATKQGCIISGPGISCAAIITDEKNEAVLCQAFLFQFMHYRPNSIVQGFDHTIVHPFYGIRHTLYAVEIFFGYLKGIM